jgi:8-oxo-dGTP pyrophosphatase MutT (NUDIX family)
MSAAFSRLSRLHAVAAARPAPELFGDHRLEHVTEFQPAAVLIALTERPEPGVLLLHRPETMRTHPGQVAFPGGKIDPGESPEQAALREAWEELGIAAAAVRVVGTGDRYKTGSGYDITPVLATIPANIAITPNPAEVSQWFEAPFSHVLDPANHTQKLVEWEGAMRPYFEIMWQDHCIWGVTAALLVNLSRRLRWHD